MPSIPSAINFTRTIKKVRGFEVAFAVSGSGSRVAASIRFVTAEVKVPLVEFGSSFVRHSWVYLSLQAFRLVLRSAKHFEVVTKLVLEETVCSIDFCRLYLNSRYLFGCCLD